MKTMDLYCVQLLVVIVGSYFAVIVTSDDDGNILVNRLNGTLSHNSHWNDVTGRVGGLDRSTNFPRYDNRPPRPRTTGMAERNQMSAVLWTRQRARDGCNKKIKISNGVSVFRRKGSIVKFICSQGFSLLGATIAVCLSSRWSEPPPICVKSGCTSVRQPLNGGAMFHMDGAVVSFQCSWDYVLDGNAVLYCDGIRWNGTEPVCNPLHMDEETTTTTHNPNADWDYVSEAERVQNTSDKPQESSSVPSGGAEAWDENPEVATTSRMLSEHSTTVHSLETSTPAIAKSSVSYVSATFKEPTTPFPTSSVQEHQWDNSVGQDESSSSSSSLPLTSTGSPETHKDTTTISATTQVPKTDSEISEVEISSPTPPTSQPTTVASTTTPPTIKTTKTASQPTSTSIQVFVTTPKPTTPTTASPQGRPTRRTNPPPFRWPPRPKTRPTRRPIVLRPRTRRTTKAIVVSTSPQPKTTSNSFVSTTSKSSETDVIPPRVETPTPKTTIKEHHEKFDEELSYNPHPPEFIQPISPHKLDVGSSHEEYHRLAHVSMVGGILLAVIGSVFLLGGVAMYCWRKNKGIARARPCDIDGRTLSASDAMEDFTWMESRDYRR